MKSAPLKNKTVIVVTDGDKRAFETIKEAARYIKAKIIKDSAGNPSLSDPLDIVHQVKMRSGTIIVFADNAGSSSLGKGTKLITELKRSGLLHAALAVASKTTTNKGVKINKSVTKRGFIIEKAVDKYGKPTNKRKIIGDTVTALNNTGIPIIGIGDIGKAPHGRARSRVAAIALQEAIGLVEGNQR
jgi:hypothetical protein